MLENTSDAPTASIPLRHTQGGVVLELKQGEVLVEFDPATSRDTIEKKILPQHNLENVPRSGGRHPVRPLEETLPNVRWVRNPEQSTEVLRQQLLEHNEVRIAQPVYHRPDLDRPTALTFRETLLARFTGSASVPEGAMPDGLILNEVPWPIRVLDGRLGRYRVVRADGRAATAEDIFRVVDGLGRDPNVESVGPDWWQLLPGTSAGTAKDPSASKGNHLKLINWTGDRNPRGAPAVIAILDSGCDLGHADLQTQYVASDRWWDAIAGDNGPPDDLEGHGTCCAGLAAGAWNDDVSVGGIAPNCRIMPVRMMPPHGITEGSMVAALEWATNKGADVASMSWHYEGPHDNFDASLAGAHAARVILVAAAGNVDSLEGVDYPASHPLVLAVGGSDENNQRHTQGSPDGEDWGSQYGPELGVMAPGSGLWTTDIRADGGFNQTGGGQVQVAGVTYEPSGTTDGNYFACFGGTSGATAQVAGLAGLLRSQRPDLPADQVRTIIESTCQQLPRYKYNSSAAHPSGPWNPEMGHGIIDVKAALASAVAQPAPPAGRLPGKP